MHDVKNVFVVEGGIHHGIGEESHVDDLGAGVSGGRLPGERDEGEEVVADDLFVRSAQSGHVGSGVSQKASRCHDSGWRLRASDAVERGNPAKVPHGGVIRPESADIRRLIVSYFRDRRFTGVIGRRRQVEWFLGSTIVRVARDPPGALGACADQRDGYYRKLTGPYLCVATSSSRTESPR